MKNEINASSSDTKSPPRKGCNIAVLIFGIIVLTAVVGFFVLCRFSAWRWMQDTHADLDMSDPERRRWGETSTGLSFPSDTIWEGAHAGFWLEADIYLRFRIRKKELAELFASLPLEWSSTKRFMTNANNSYRQRWFHPDSIENFQSAELNLPEERHAVRSS